MVGGGGGGGKCNIDRQTNKHKKIDDKLEQLFTCVHFVLGLL